jgi:hypothetical protein
MVVRYLAVLLPLPVLRERVGVRVFWRDEKQSPHPSPLPAYRERGPERPDNCTRSIDTIDGAIYSQSRQFSRVFERSGEALGMRTRPTAEV